MIATEAPPTLDELPDILTADQVAAYLQVSYQQVCRLCREGKLPCRYAGRYPRIPKRRLVEWLEEA